MTRRALPDVWIPRLLLLLAAGSLGAYMADGVFHSYRLLGDGPAVAASASVAIVVGYVAMAFIATDSALGRQARVLASIGAAWAFVVIVLGRVDVLVQAFPDSEVVGVLSVLRVLVYGVGMPLVFAILVGAASYLPRVVERVDAAFDIWTEPEPVPEVARETGEVRRRRRRRELRGTHSPRDVRRLYHRQRGECAVCSASLRAGYHKDHVHPISRGGPNTCGNLQLLCKTCNLSKGASFNMEFRRRRGDLSAMLSCIAESTHAAPGGG